MVGARCSLLDPHLSTADQLSSGADAEVSEAPSGSPFDVLKRLKGNTDT